MGGGKVVSQSSTIVQMEEPHGFCRGGLGGSWKGTADAYFPICLMEGAPLAIPFLGECG